MRLLLFDIDGTLINSSRIGRKAMGNALRQVFGTAGALETYEFAGKTDKRIVFDLMRDAGWPEADIEARFPVFVDAMAAHGEELFTPHRIRACPGVPALLKELSARDDVFLGLLTGNLERTAPLKLRAAGIEPEMFRVAAYGSESCDRDDLIGIAVRRAANDHALSPAEQDVVVIGDTPADIRCARAGRATAVVVATGPFTAAALRRHKPDHLFQDLSQTQDVLTALLGSDASLRKTEGRKMHARKRLEIDGIIFDTAQPTTLTREALFNWVIWQFPRVRQGKHSGAIRPSLPGHGWYPALLDPECREIVVYAHVKEAFPSPEAAARYLEKVRLT